MLRSMTGFGQSSRDVGGVHYVVELRSVNGRYFKASIRLPELLGSFESELEQALRQRLHRGSIDLTLRMKSQVAAAAYDLNLPALERYIDQLEAVQPDRTELKLTVDLASLLELPGVCQPPAPDAFAAQAHDAVMAMVQEAIERLLEMRTREGQSVAADLAEHCALMQRKLAEIGGRTDVVVRDYHQRLKRRVEELIASAQIRIDQEDLAREVAVFAERCDISEELSRLTAHLDQFRTTMESEDQPGRKLDFIAQEMLREANTISAKANDAQIARAVVDIKTAVDRIKEQVQNVE